MEEYGNGQLPHSPGIQDTSLQNCTQGTAPTFSMRNILSWYVVLLSSSSSILPLVPLPTILEESCMIRITLIIRLEDLTLLSHLSLVGKHSGTGIRQITHTPS